jgi:agmatinase
MDNIQKRFQKRQRVLKNFNSGTNGLFHKGLFGLPFDVSESELVVIPVPWDVTTSYRDGSLEAPEAILEASWQIDLFNKDFENIWQLGMALDKVPTKWKESSHELKKIRKKILRKAFKSQNAAFNTELFNDYKNINYLSRLLNEWVEQRAEHHLELGKIVGVLGGDHSTPLGLMIALSKIHDSYSVLQIDAHADLREKYEGFDFSHASIMFNALKISQIEKLVQVGVRDYCEEENNRIKENPERIRTFTDSQLKQDLFSGMSWKTLVDEIISTLGDKVYISFDIDGLDPFLCPNTGTPVPGGLGFDQVSFLLSELQKSNKQIIGFDLCEVSPGLAKNDDWDANVGMRILYQLCCRSLLSTKTENPE